MGKLIVISHPEVVVTPGSPITEWGLSDLGLERAKTFARSSVMSSVGAIWSSCERKTLETASVLARMHNLKPNSDHRLGENDRSATGFLPIGQFEAAADAFFAAPGSSFRGWETANAAQKRIVEAVTSIVKVHDFKDLGLVTHGAVGTLLWCHLSGENIDRRFDQPGQGHYWSADLENLRPDFSWRSIT
ncbi:histidine phosphatase family protein [Ruegeria arenilitoris]|uniref:histidine phosphatase family protein n=1 Tax=Ruegeria arenilitoris TaxID=1173585 RepID=UPI00147D8B93|nr:histidine phosphatase family protein [Ruegeria arenilitoris]